MPWGIEKEGSTLRVHILAPMTGEWDALEDELQTHLKPVPLAVYIPSQVTGGTGDDARRLAGIWRSLTDLGIVIRTPQ